MITKLSISSKLHSLSSKINWERVEENKTMNHTVNFNTFILD